MAGAGSVPPADGRRGCAPRRRRASGMGPILYMEEPGRRLTKPGRSRGDDVGPLAVLDDGVAADGHAGGVDRIIIVTGADGEIVADQVSRHERDHVVAGTVLQGRLLADVRIREGEDVVTLAGLDRER